MPRAAHSTEDAAREPVVHHRLGPDAEGIGEAVGALLCLARDDPAILPQHLAVAGQADGAKVAASRGGVKELLRPPLQPRGGPPYWDSGGARAGEEVHCGLCGQLLEGLHPERADGCPVSAEVEQLAASRLGAPKQRKDPAAVYGRDAPRVPRQHRRGELLGGDDHAAGGIYLKDGVAGRAENQHRLPLPQIGQVRCLPDYILRPTGYED
mmetsp:Transcript_12849/g.30478  ORF Transcript_12849/g.30478 Transcript_12849/m.30478 type:complete len:210 (+) Transcript_12849:4297-4926(+)